MATRAKAKPTVKRPVRTVRRKPVGQPPRQTAVPVEATARPALREIELVAPPPSRPAAPSLDHWPLAAVPAWHVRLRTWWRHLWLKRPAGAARTPQQQKMADVQAAVQQALAERGVTGAAPPRDGRPGVGWWRPVAGWRLSRRQQLAAAAVLAVLLLVVIYQGHTPTGPAQAVASIHHSIVKGDVADFERQVDVAAVATSAINQLFGATDGAADGAANGAAGSAAMALLPGTVGRASAVTPTKMLLRSDLKTQLEAFLKPGLADSLKNEMIDAVARRSWRATRQADPDSLLLHLWQAAGGEQLQLGETKILSADAERAAAEVMLSRADVPLALPLRLELDRSEGTWQLVDLPNLVEVLNQLSQAGTRAVTQASAQTVDQLGQLVHVSDVTKARAVDGQLLVGARLINTGPVDLRNLRIQLVFADAAGQPMKVALLDEPSVLTSGALRQKTWAVMIDPRNSQERYVRDLPLDALSVTAGVIGVTLPGGKRLTTEPLVLQRVEE